MYSNLKIIWDNKIFFYCDQERVLSLNALKQYVNIGNNLRNDPTIIKLKRELKNLPPIYKSIRPFLVYNIPSFRGKTQTPFAFDQDLLPFYFTVNQSYGQAIYRNFKGTNRVLNAACSQDMQGSGRSNFNAFEMLQQFANKKMYTLGYFKALISSAIQYKSLDPKPTMSWMEYLIQPVEEVPIIPISIEEFRECFPLDIKHEFGSLSSKLLDYVIVLDEFPSVSKTGGDQYFLTTPFFIRDLARAVGFSVMILGASSPTYDIINVSLPVPTDTDLAPLALVTEQMHWCTVFYERTTPHVPSLISEFGCSQYCEANDPSTFNCEALAQKGIVRSVAFILDQLKTSSPGISELILKSLAGLITNPENYENEAMFWNNMCTTTVQCLEGQKCLSAQNGTIASSHMMANPEMSSNEAADSALTNFIQYHLFYLKPEVDSQDYRNGNSSSIKLYYPHPLTNPDKLRFLHHSGALQVYVPRVEAPNPENEFFTFVASQSSSHYNSSNALYQLKIILNEINAGGTDFFHYKNLCVANVCRASASTSDSTPNEGPSISGDQFIRQLMHGFVPFQARYSGQGSTPSETDEKSKKVLDQFKIPRLSVCDAPWSESIKESLKGILELGNLSKRTSASESEDKTSDIYVEFDLERKGKFYEKGGCLFANNPNDPSTSDSILTRLKDPSISAAVCPLLVIPSQYINGVVTKSYKLSNVLQAYLKKGKINLYIVRYNPRSRLDITPALKSILFANPSRVVLIIETFFREGYHTNEE